MRLMTLKRWRASRVRWSNHPDSCVAVACTLLYAAPTVTHTLSLLTHALAHTLTHTVTDIKNDDFDVPFLWFLDSLPPHVFERALLHDLNLDTKSPHALHTGAVSVSTS